MCEYIYHCILVMCATQRKHQNHNAGIDPDKIYDGRRFLHNH